MGLIGFLSVLAGMAVIFGAEEGLVEEKAWSNEMAAIENATKQHDTSKFRYALMDDMTWNLARDACSAISNEYELCTVSELCSQTEDGLKAHTLCQPQSQCDGLEAVGGFHGRWAPVQKDGGVSDGEWVNVEENCKVRGKVRVDFGFEPYSFFAQVGNFPQDNAVKGILACCHNGVVRNNYSHKSDSRVIRCFLQLLPIHPPPFPGANAGSVAASREEHGIHSPEWEWSTYATQVPIRGYQRGDGACLLRSQRARPFGCRGRCRHRLAENPAKRQLRSSPASSLRVRSEAVRRRRHRRCDRATPSSAARRR